MLLNLLNNAIRFTDQGRIEVGALEEDGEIVVSVSDTGVGIPKDRFQRCLKSSIRPKDRSPAAAAVRGWGWPSASSS